MLLFKMKWWTEMKGMTYWLSLNFPLVQRPKKCIKNVECFRGDLEQTTKPMLLGCQTRRWVWSPGLSGEPVVIPGACTRQVDPLQHTRGLYILSMSAGCSCSALSEREVSASKKVGRCYKINLLIFCSPQSQIRGNAEMGVSVVSYPGALLNCYIQHHSCVWKDLVVEFRVKVKS